MRKKSHPGEGSERRAEQFQYTPTPFGIAKAWSGFAAAEPYWCKVHEHTKATPGTKVCVSWYTDGALLCPRCRPAVVPTTVAYVALYREIDHKPCLVIVHESAAALLADVKFGTRVLIGCVERGSSVFVRPTEDQTRMKTENPLRLVPADLSLTLYTLWAYPQLTEWVNRGQKTSEKVEKVQAPKVVTEPGAGVPLKTERLAVYFDAEAEKLNEARERARKNAEFIRTVKPPSTNGKHTRKGDE